MTDSIRKNILKSVSYVLSAQLLILVISVIRSLILPAFFSVSSFGYWEIYLFYTAYTGIFCFGYNDGIYLRYGEYNYKDLPMQILRSANQLYLIQLLVCTLLAIVAINLFVEETNTRFSMSFAAMNIVFMGLYGLLIYILQITNQFKKYSFFSVIDKILVLITIACMFVVNVNNFKVVIIVDFLSKIGVVFLMILRTKDLWFGKSNFFFVVATTEYAKNITVGIKLMIANLMSMLIIGAGRLIVQIFGNIEDFGTYSFGISVTGLVVVTITAFSLVLYPILKRLSMDNYAFYFDKINVFTRTFCILSLLLYFPAYWLVSTLYIKYIPVLMYLNLLFGIVYLQGKISILNNTFYKVLREEKSMLSANISCLAIFIVLALVGYSVYPSVYMIAMSTFVAMLFRCYASEIYLQRKLEKHFDFRLIYEIAILVLFVALSAFCNLAWSFIIYFSLCVIYLGIDRIKIYETAMILLKKES